MSYDKVDNHDFRIQIDTEKLRNGTAIHSPQSHGDELFSMVIRSVLQTLSSAELRAMVDLISTRVPCSDETMSMHKVTADYLTKQADKMVVRLIDSLTSDGSSWTGTGQRMEHKTGVVIEATPLSFEMTSPFKYEFSVRAANNLGNAIKTCLVDKVLEDETVVGSSLGSARTLLRHQS